MKTLPEKIKEPIERFINKIDTSLFMQKYRDKECYFFGHIYTFLRGGKSGHGEYVCGRCNRWKDSSDGIIFNHNWEMDYGEFARCHDHSKLNKE